MLMLTHEGPGYRSRLIARETALAKAAELLENPEYTGVTTLGRRPSARRSISRSARVSGRPAAIA
jgi:hypothetical protein